MKRSMVVSLVCIWMVGIVFSSAAYARTYKIGAPAWAGFSAANVAEVQGFWQEQGLDVQVFSIANSDEALNLFKRGVVDFSFDMIGTAIGLYMEGLPLVVLAETDWSYGGDKIIAKQNIGPDDVKGKPIGVYYNKPSITYFLAQYLATLGLQIADTKIIEMELDILSDQFIADRLGIIVSYDPEALRAERDGNGKVVATSATYEGSLPEGMMVLEKNLQTIPQEDLVKLFKGLIKGADWINEASNWPEYMEILNAHTFKQDAPYPEEDLRAMVDAVHIHDADMLLQRNQDGGGLSTYLQNLKLFLSSNNLLGKDFDPEVIFDSTAILKALNTP